MLPRPALLLAAALGGFGFLSAAPAKASCYSVFDAQQRLLWRDSSSPVALDGPLHEALQERFGAGARMVMAGGGGECARVGVPATPAQYFEAPQRQREPIEVGADSWPATEGGRVYPAAWPYRGHRGHYHPGWARPWRD